MGFLSPLCPVCNSGSEIATHALFFCQFARSFWFASPFSVRFESMPDDPTMLLFHVTSILQGFLFTSFANHLWALWKFRCKHTCEGAPLIVDPILKMAEYYNRLSRITSNLAIQKPLRHIWTAQAPNLHEGFNCFVDGSFISTGSAGWAYLLMNGKNLIQYELQSGESLSAFEAELKALSLAVKTAILLELNACSFFTDCSQLQQIMDGRLAPETCQWQWQCFNEVLDLLNNFRSHPGFVCSYIPRESNLDSHLLANYARIHGIVCIDFSYPLFSLVSDMEQVVM
ncbi:hypothetical protein LUZ62_071063 [Rhynchospora pubera]|uniref:RNase H type-1 domain-containing protein n=1 Tax=Rhynchospora pubera TaxID=906938 RepID=A0AAV8D322_9POAL|nr:hypothetical protein LUZ62_071063 [Rhynchospora pubera]